MPIADANSLQISYGLETAFGVSPAGAGAYTQLQWSSESFKPAQQKIRSNNINPSRELVDTVRNAISAQGGFGHDWLAGNTDRLIQAALQSAALTGAGTVCSGFTSVQAIVANNRFQTAATWTLQPSAGRFIKVTGFANAQNNGIFKVNTSTTSQIDTGGKILVVEAAGPAITILQMGYYQLGTTFESFSIEKKFTNLTNTFELLTGMYVSQMSMGLGNGIVTGQFGFVGKRSENKTASTGSAPVAAPSNPVMNVVDNLVVLLDNGIAPATGVGLDFANALRPQNNQVGTPFAVGVGNGEATLSGSHEAYFENNAQLDAFYNNTARSLDVILADSASKGYAFELPRIKFGDAERVAGGKDTDIIVKLPWDAMKLTAAYGFRIHATGA